MSKITLATLATATAQQVFDQVRDHLLRQGRQSLLATGRDQCAYRGHDGLQCAAGCLISDEEYHFNLERFTWDALAHQGRVPFHHAPLVKKLQRIHDTREPTTWERHLRALAAEQGLAWTITLATLPTASAQEVFEQAAKHLLKQNDRSMDVRGSGCAYRGRGGLACAAGALLSNADAATLTPHQNGLAWDDLIESGAAPDAHRSLIRRLQRLHDGFYPADWRSMLRALARDYELDSSFMDLLPVPYVPVSARETASI